MSYMQELEARLEAGRLGEAGKEVEVLDGLLASLATIKNNSADSQIQAAIILFQMKVTPAVVVNVGFGWCFLVDAFSYIAHRKTERVPIDQLEGRITTSLLTPYPPGIPLLIPGERFNRRIVDFLKFTRQFNAAFPGFDTDVHGLVEEDSETGRSYYVDCVRD